MNLNIILDLFIVLVSCSNKLAILEAFPSNGRKTSYTRNKTNPSSLYCRNLKAIQLGFFCNKNQYLEESEVL